MDTDRVGTDRTCGNRLRHPVRAVGGTVMTWLDSLPPGSEILFFIAVFLLCEYLMMRRGE